MLLNCWPVCAIWKIWRLVFADTLDTFIPYFVNQTNRAIIKEEAHRRAHQAGFGAEWDIPPSRRERSPMQAGYNAKLVDAFMAANGDFDTAVDKLLSASRH